MTEWERITEDMHVPFDGLRTKERHTLLRHGFRSPAEVAAASDAELLAIRSLGALGVLRVRAWLRDREGD